MIAKSDWLLVLA